MSEDGRSTTGAELPRRLERALSHALLMDQPPRQLQVRDRPHTTLRLVATERGRVWLKSYRRGGDDALREYQFLCRAQDALQGAAALGVPEPIAHLEPATIVLGDVSGRPMREVLAHGSDADCEMAVRRCAQWLAAVHGVGQDTSTFDMGLAARFVADGWDGLADRAVSLSQAARPCDRVSVITHGDFAPHNVIIAGEQVVVLDPSFHDEFGRREGRCSRHEDLARFWVSLRGLTPADHRSQRRRALAAAFLEAYAGATAIWTPGFVLFAVLQMGLALRDWSGLPPVAQSLRLREWLAELDEGVAGDQ